MPDTLDDVPGGTNKKGHTESERNGHGVSHNDIDPRTELHTDPVMRVTRTKCTILLL